jgi:preprotein translocase subunit SecE
MPSGAFFRIRFLFHYLIMNLFTYFKSVRAELKEVAWPTRAQTVSFTIIVILLSVFFAVFLGGVDFGLKTALTHFLNK